MLADNMHPAIKVKQARANVAVHKLPRFLYVIVIDHRALQGT